MSDQPGQPLLSPAEARFLTGFVRRQMIPWFAGTTALALTLAAAAFAVATHLAEPAIAPRSLERASAGGASPAELAALRDELAGLRGEFGEQLEAARRDLAAVDQRIAEATEGVESLRSRISKAEKAVKAAAPRATGPALASTDLDAMLERLSNLETRQQEIEGKRESFAKDVLNRLYAVETGRDRAEANRLENEEKSQARLRNLEERFSQLEAKLTGVPAAPTP